MGSGKERRQTKTERLKERVEIDPEHLVRLTEAGNITEIMYSEKRSRGGYIAKIDKDSYMDKRTGEVKAFEHIENRSQDLDNVAKSLKRLRDLLNANITDTSKCRWVTLTYKENMTDPQKLRIDFAHFNERLRKIYGRYEYITAAEPQGRGAWHLHCVFIFPDKAPYMDNQTVAQAWHKGFVTVKRLDNVDNVGAYLTAYLGDMELTDEQATKMPESVKGIKEITYKDSNGETQTKRYIKGARLCMYPPKFNIYRKSKGIKEPTVTVVPYRDAKQKVCCAEQTFSKTVALDDAEKKYHNVLQYEYYNSILDAKSQEYEYVFEGGKNQKIEP